MLAKEHFLGTVILKGLDLFVILDSWFKLHLMCLHLHVERLGLFRYFYNSLVHILSLMKVIKVKKLEFHRLLVEEMC